MDLVDEEDAADPGGDEALTGGGDGAADLDDAGHDRGQGVEVGVHCVREQSGEAGLAGAGRAPEEEAREVAALDAAPQRSALPDEVLLADELVEGPRAHPGRERLAVGRRLEQAHGLGAHATA